MICKFVRTCALLGLVSCSSGGAASQGAERGAPAPLAVLTSISTFKSFVSAVGGTRVRVESLVPVGVSPEDYQPTPADIERLHAARLLIENGLGLEAWLARTIENARNPNLTVIVASRGLPSKAGNPHLWMDPELARGYVRAIRDALTAIDPGGRELFSQNAQAYDRRLVALDHEIAKRIATIPAPSRTMIVFHNAWQYYDDRFGLRTLGVIEPSPGQEPNPAYVASLVGLARRHHVRAVFAEPEYSPKLVQTLAQSAGIATVEDLYDDSIGTDPRVYDYDSMLRYDTSVIAKALGGR